VSGSYLVGWLLQCETFPFTGKWGKSARGKVSKINSLGWFLVALYLWNIRLVFGYPWNAPELLKLAVLIFVTTWWIEAGTNFYFWAYNLIQLFLYFGMWSPCLINPFDCGLLVWQKLGMMRGAYSASWCSALRGHDRGIFQFWPECSSHRVFPLFRGVHPECSLKTHSQQALITMECSYLAHTGL